MILPETERPKAIQRAKELLLDEATKILHVSIKGIALRSEDGEVLVITPHLVEFTSRAECPVQPSEPAAC
jgi:hypothetical protein